MIWRGCRQNRCLRGRPGTRRIRYVFCENMALDVFLGLLSKKERKVFVVVPTAWTTRENADYISRKTIMRQRIRDAIWLQTTEEMLSLARRILTWELFCPSKYVPNSIKAL